MELMGDSLRNERQLPIEERDRFENEPFGSLTLASDRPLAGSDRTAVIGILELDDAGGPVHINFDDPQVADESTSVGKGEDPAFLNAITAARIDLGEDGSF